jgi:DNA-binding MarR family transcriptional regulator
MPRSILNSPPDTSADLLRSLAGFRSELRHFLLFSESAARRAGIPAQQHQLLLQVAGAPAGELVTVAYIAARLGLRHNSVVELSNRCETAGLLKRTVNPSNRRQVLLSVTARGRRALDKLSADHARELDELGPRLISTLGKIRSLRSLTSASSQSSAGSKQSSISRKKSPSEATR